MIIFWYLVSALLLCFSVTIAAYNWRIAFLCYVVRRPAPSWIPFIGGLAGIFGVICLPFDGAAKWWWAPLILDWGTLPGTIFALVFHWVYRREIYGDSDNEAHL
jgi:hypothetical protein